MKKQSKKQGGKREGAGRPALYQETMKTYSIALTPEQAAYLDLMGPNRSAAVRALINRAQQEQ